MTASGSSFNIPELERIVLEEVRSVSSKAKLLSFISVMKGLEEGSGNEEQTMKAIAIWIEETWPTQTVRAKMAQKIARMIREGEWRTQE